MVPFAAQSRVDNVRAESAAHVHQISRGKRGHEGFAVKLLNVFSHILISIYCTVPYDTSGKIGKARAVKQYLKMAMRVAAVVAFARIVLPGTDCRSS